MDLIITCARHCEDETKKEIHDILESLGDGEPQIVITKFSGILMVNTMIDFSNIIKKIHKILEDEPWSIRYMLRVIPICSIVETDVIRITETAIDQAKKLKPNETYRITIEKRNSAISSSDIISQIANKIQNRVSLEKYDWVILIQILDNVSGVSIVKNEDVLSIEKVKRGLRD